MSAPKFVVLPNGNAIRADWIGAIRLGDASDADYLAEPIKPRVIVDFGSTVRPNGASQINCTIVYFDDNEARDEYARTLRAEIEAALKVQS
jgi:hypothetical protein